MQHVRLRVTGMGCPRCVRDVTRWLRDVPGVETVTADAAAGEITLGGVMQLADVLAAVTASPFDATVLDEDEARS
jgi:copper chaperone CopZ